MSSAEVIQNQATAAGVALIVSGFISMTMRRHLVLNVLGFHLIVLGSTIFGCGPSPGTGRWTAAILLVGTSLFAPVAMTVVARWRVGRGSADRSTLQESRGDDQRA